MTYEIRILKDGAELGSREVSADEVVALILGGATPASASVARTPRKGTTPKTASSKYAKKTDSELMEHASRQHPATAEVEQMLIEGLTTAAIMEKVEISAPTVSVIRARLRKEGRLSD
jgi:hypothetical protein